MKRFEYNIVTKANSMMVSELNLFGNQGWELVNIEFPVLDEDTHYAYTFKRERNTEPSYF